MTTLPCEDFQNEKEYQIITKHWEFVAVSVSESFALFQQAWFWGWGVTWEWSCYAGVQSSVESFLFKVSYILKWVEYVGKSIYVVLSGCFSGERLTQQGGLQREQSW